MTGVPPEIAAEYTAAGWWGTRTTSALLRDLRARRPDDTAYVTPEARTSWRDYDELADRIARTLAGLGVAPGERVGVFLPDGLEVHATLVATTRAGVVAVGIGARAGDAEIDHLLRRTGARVLVTMREHRSRPTARLVETLRDRGVSLAWHIVLGADGVDAVHDERGVPVTVDDADVLAELALGANDLFMLNSTSGTTGLPKCVTQFENRWLHFVDLAVETGRLGQDEVFLAAVPAPYGFGLWTSHFAPLALAAPTAVLPRFDADEMVRLVERERVTVLCCVSTQFRMLLNSPVARTADLSSLRVMYTGGEAIPVDRALEFERRTGAAVLQFFGSNESGAFSATTLDDTPYLRATTCGRVLPHMDVRLYEGGFEVSGPGAVGQPGGRGPLTCLGYYDDPEANAELFTDDGHLLMGDLVTVDADGYLTLVGRTADVVIRGGKNVSAPQVEAEVETHPAVDLVAIVGVPDDVYGERVCAVITLRDGAALTLPELGEHLTARGVTRELHPEHLLVVEALPMASGGKVAKGEVRKLATAAVGRPG